MKGRKKIKSLCFISMVIPSICGIFSKAAFRADVTSATFRMPFAALAGEKRQIDVHPHSFGEGDWRVYYTPSSGSREALDRNAAGRSDEVPCPFRIDVTHSEITLALCGSSGCICGNLTAQLVTALLTQSLAAMSQKHDYGHFSSKRPAWR